MRLIFKLITILLVAQTAMYAIGTQFLYIPMTSSELIIGINPASQNVIYRPVLSASYGNWLGDINVSTFGYDRKIFGGTGGINVRYVSLSDLELRLDRPIAEPLSAYNASAIAVDGSFSAQTNFGIVNTKIRYISIQLFDESANGAAMDVSLNRDINDNVGIGASVLNLGYMNELYKENPQLPTRFILGARYDLDISKIDNSIFLALEKSTAVNGIIFRIGDVSTWNNLQVMLGAQISKNTTSISGGIGLRLGAYQIGYGIQVGTQALGIPQIFDISVTLP